MSKPCNGVSAFVIEAASSRIAGGALSGSGDRAIRNGRQLHELINEAGFRYLTALKKQQ